MSKKYVSTQELILNAVEEGILDKNDVILALILWIGETDLRGIVEANDWQIGQPSKDVNDEDLELETEGELE